VVGVLVLALLVGAGAWYADQRSRASEIRALDACRRELHDAAVSSDLQMMAVATTTHGPLAAPRGAARLGLAGLMSRSARQLLPDVVGADEVCRAVSVRPWHVSLKTRRDAATAYADALAAKLRRVAADGSTSYIDDGALRRLRRDADLEEFGGRS
jgi:hypothetical protein